MKVMPKNITNGEICYQTVIKQHEMLMLHWLGLKGNPEQVATV